LLSSTAGPVPGTQQPLLAGSGRIATRAPPSRTPLRGYAPVIE